MAAARDFIWSPFYRVQICRMYLMPGNLLRHRKWRFKRKRIMTEPVLNRGRCCRMNSIKTFLFFCLRIDTLSFLRAILESLLLFIHARKKRRKVDEIHYTLLEVSTFIMWNVPKSKWRVLLLCGKHNGVFFCHFCVGYNTHRETVEMWTRTVHL